MGEAMASSSTARGEPSRMCKRVTVVILALIHVMVTLYVVRLIFNSTVPDCLRGMSPLPTPQTATMTELQLARRTAAIEHRRQATPLLLILRVKDIEAEVAMSTKRQGPASDMEKTEEEELKEQVTLDAEQLGGPAIVDDPMGALQRALLPPDKCQPEPNTDFAGFAVRWGITFLVNNPAECCKACSRQASYARGSQRKCNVWVFCPNRKGCPSPDGYAHKFGECWLKQSVTPRAVFLDYSRVMPNQSGPPLPVLWISGVMPVSE